MKRIQIQEMITWSLKEASRIIVSAFSINKGTNEPADVGESIGKSGILMAGLYANTGKDCSRIGFINPTLLVINVISGH